MSYDCEIPEFYSEACHVAKKQHKCVECAKPIEVGEQYVSCRMKYDGMFDVYKQHVRCYHFARYVNHGPPAYAHNGGCIPFGEIRCELEQCEDISWDDDFKRHVALTPVGEMFLKVLAGEDVAPRIDTRWNKDATKKD